MRIVVAGMFARVPAQGGLVWVVVQWVLGLRRLGHDVLLIEPVEAAEIVPAGSPLARSDNARYFGESLQRFGLRDGSALLLCGTRQTIGSTYEQVRRRAREADLIINFAGGLRDPELLEHIPRRLYLDLDPGFTQLWHTVEGIDMRFAGHTHFATVGLAMRDAGCRVPRCDIDWIVTCPPVVIDEWPFADEIERDALTTVANWRGYGSIEAGGVLYGQKAHSVRTLIDLPLRTGRRFELALSIDAGEPRDIDALAKNGWSIVDPLRVAATPQEYRGFIQGSRGELGVAKSGYVRSRCGWFSDRSACYLASGRPVLAQETGFSTALPVGAGLFPFEDADDVEAALDELDRRYDYHRKAARALAEDNFHSDVVLTRLLDNIGGGA